jgi:hypothetical protein
MFFKPLSFAGELAYRTQLLVMDVYPLLDAPLSKTTITSQKLGTTCNVNYTHWSTFMLYMATQGTTTNQPTFHPIHSSKIPYFWDNVLPHGWPYHCLSNFFQCITHHPRPQQDHNDPPPKAWISSTLFFLSSPKRETIVVFLSLGCSSLRQVCHFSVSLSPALSRMSPVRVGPKMCALMFGQHPNPPPLVCVVPFPPQLVRALPFFLALGSSMELSNISSPPNYGW